LQNLALPYDFLLSSAVLYVNKWQQTVPCIFYIHSGFRLKLWPTANFQNVSASRTVPSVAHPG